MDVPRIISVDDHIVEPPDLWQRWLPARFRDEGPRVVRVKGRIAGRGGWQETDQGGWGGRLALRGLRDGDHPRLRRGRDGPGLLRASTGIR